MNDLNKRKFRIAGGKLFTDKEECFIEQFMIKLCSDKRVLSITKTFLCELLGHYLERYPRATQISSYQNSAPSLNWLKRYLRRYPNAEKLFINNTIKINISDLDLKSIKSEIVIFLSKALTKEEQAAIQQLKEMRQANQTSERQKKCERTSICEPVRKVKAIGNLSVTSRQESRSMSTLAKILPGNLYKRKVKISVSNGSNQSKSSVSNRGRYSKAQKIPDDAHQVEQITYKEGAWLEARDYDGFYRAKIVKVFPDKTIKVHFEGWSTSYDKIYPIGSPLLRGLTAANAKEIHMREQSRKRSTAAVVKENSNNVQLVVPPVKMRCQMTADKKLADYLIHLVCIEGLTFRQITSIDQLRSVFKSNSHDLTGELKSVLYDAVNRARDSVKCWIRKQKLEGKTFTVNLHESICFDQKHRCAHATLRTSESEQPLAMIPVGAADAKDLLKKMLLRYGLHFDMDRIVCTTSYEEDQRDRSAKDGGLEGFSLLQLRCLISSLHQSVRDVLSTKRHSDLISEDESDEERCSDDGRDFGFEYKKNFEVLRCKVRRFVSGLPSGTLVRVNKKDEKLVPDSKHDWISTVNMFNGFYKLVKAEDGVAAKDFTRDELNHVKDYYKALKHIALVVGFLKERKDLNVLEAERAFVYALDQLASYNTRTSCDLAHHLRRRYLERRDTELVHLVTYLDAPGAMFNGGGVGQPPRSDRFGRKMNRRAVEKLALDLIGKLELVKGWSGDVSGTQQLDETTKMGKLSSFVAGKQASCSHQEEDASVERMLKQEMGLFELSKKLPFHLDKLNQVLLTLKPTCTNSNEAFRAMDYFISKYWPRSISHERLDALVWMRQHLKSSNAA